MARRPKNAIERQYDSLQPKPTSARDVAIQMSGYVAKFRGTCDKCLEDYDAKVTRIVPSRRPGRYIHVSCAQGFDDE